MRKMLCTILIAIIVVASFSVMFIVAKAAVPVPVLGNDNDGNKVFEVSGNKYLAWGIDLETFKSRDGDINYLHKQIDAAVYVNSTFVNLPVCWKTIEPTKDNFTFQALAGYLNLIKNHGLKTSILWTGINYASGDCRFIPDWVYNDTTTYTDITASWRTTFNRTLCPNDPDTLAREKLAYYKLVEWLKNNDLSNTVMSICANGELDYVGAMKYPDEFVPPNLNRRCECSTCNSLYSGQGEILFMRQSFHNYAKTIIDYSASLNWDIPTINQVCPKGYWGGDWRYAENGSTLKSTINRSNNFSSPSVVNCQTLTTFVTELDNFMPSNIPDNVIYCQGIDQAAQYINGGRPECGPWMNLLWYGGVGSINWDTGAANETYSIVSNEGMRDMLRKYWGPLKGMHYQLSRLKSSPTKKFWWKLGESSKSGSTSNFSFSQTNGGNEYGVAFELGASDVCFAGTTYGNAYTMNITRSAGWSGFNFEKGYFDLTSGAWKKTGYVSPTINGNTASVTVNTDSGDFTQVVYRFYSGTSPSPANIALSATASSSSQNPSYPASLVNDGYESTSTLSASSPSFPQTLTLTWGSGQTFDMVNLTSSYCQGQAPKNWDVQVSTDGSTNWATVAQTGNVSWLTNNDKRETKSLRFPSVTNKKGVRIVIWDANTTWGHYAVNELSVYSTEIAENLAIGKTATMLNGNPGWGNVASYAVDGSSTTYAQSSENVPWDLQVDLGASSNYSTIVVTQDAYNYATQFTFKVSTDGINNWTTVETENAGIPGVKSYTFSSQTARYVKMDVTTTVGSYGHAVNELEVWK